jgi:hypothetical protein
VPGGQQAQQVFLACSELGNGVAAALGVQVGLVQVRAQQRKHRPVTLGEVRPGPAERVHSDGPARSDGPRRSLGQAQLEFMLDSLRPVVIAVHAGGMPLPGRVEVRDRQHAAQVAGAVGITARQAVPAVLPVQLLRSSYPGVSVNGTSRPNHCARCPLSMPTKHTSSQRIWPIRSASSDSGSPASGRS